MKVPDAFLLISVFKIKIRTHYIYSYRRIFELHAPLLCSLRGIMPFSAHPATRFAHPVPESVNFCYHLNRLLADFKTGPNSNAHLISILFHNIDGMDEIKKKKKSQSECCHLLFFISTYRFSLPKILHLFRVWQCKIVYFSTIFNIFHIIRICFWMNTSQRQSS